MKRNYNKMGHRRLSGLAHYPIEKQVIPVIPNQAVTPTEMLKMAEQGIPISMQNAPITEKAPEPSWDIAPENRKNVDAAELWQMQQNVRKKVKEAHKRDRARYGD